MAGEKATFNVGVFGIPAKLIEGVVKIKCNVRTDQKKQREIAKLPEDSTVLLVDCPGGAVKHGDGSFDDAVKREIGEETGGCTVELLEDDWSQAFPLMGDRALPYDLAFLKPVKLIGEPQPSNEASEQPWLSRQELTDATKYRAVSGLGLAGRTGRMMVAALDYYEARKNNSGLFS